MKSSNEHDSHSRSLLEPWTPCTLRPSSFFKAWPKCAWPPMTRAWSKRPRRWGSRSSLCRVWSPEPGALSPKPSLLRPPQVWPHNRRGGFIELPLERHDEHLPRGDEQRRQERAQDEAGQAKEAQAADRREEDH